MIKNKNSMKKEIQCLSNYKALMVTKAYMNTCLVLFAAATIICNFNPSPLYIVFVLNIIPPVLDFAFRDSKSPILAEKSFSLTRLKKCFNYNSKNYIFNMISSTIAIFSLLLLQINYNSLNIETFWFLPAPTFIIASSILLRILIIIYYRISLPRKILLNKF